MARNTKKAATMVEPSKGTLKAVGVLGADPVRSMVAESPSMMTFTLIARCSP